MLTQLLRRLYLSPLGRPLSAVARGLAVFAQPRMIYGYHDQVSGTFRKHTRISNTVVLIGRERLAVADHVWLGPHSILDASEGLVIDEGCQVAGLTGIFSHGSHTAIRLYGRAYIRIPSTERRGYTRGEVRIGAYSFIGAGAIILPGTTIGRGCLIGAGTVVRGAIPDKAIVVGNPMRITGSTADIDQKHLRDPAGWETYYDQEAIAALRRDGTG